MKTTKLTSKGQVVLPKSIRDARRWRSGTQFQVVETAEGVLLRQIKALPPSTVDEVAGSLATSRRPRSITEMTRAIDLQIDARRRRGRY